MKKKIIFAICMIISIILCFAACESSDSGSLAEGGNGDGLGGDIERSELNSDVSERKIIYVASMTIECDNIFETIEDIKSSLESGEWFDSEDARITSATFVARVKSDRLDSYITELSKLGTVYDYRKTATDVSLSYNNKEVRIEALNAERARLMELLENASFNESLTLNSRITAIDMEIFEIQRSLNSYDQSIEFSTVTIYLTEKYVAPISESLTFGQWFGKIFKGSFNALGEVFKIIFLVLVAIFPFALVIVPIALGTLFIVKYRRKKTAKNVSVKAAEKSKESAEFESKIDNIINKD